MSGLYAEDHRNGQVLKDILDAGNRIKVRRAVDLLVGKLAEKHRGRTFKEACILQMHHVLFDHAHPFPGLLDKEHLVPGIDLKGSGKGGCNQGEIASGKLPFSLPAALTVDLELTALRVFKHKLSLGIQGLKQ